MSDPTKAVIYCRVSGGKQVKEGNGLSSQESRCREHARYQEWEVIGVFHESAVSGGLLDRPAMNRMRDFLESQKSKIYVIVDDISRWARETQYHFALKKAIQDSGGILISLNQKLEDTPEGKFIETIYAANAELERSRNARQVRTRMRARVMNGYWCFAPVLGYKYENVSGQGKVLVPDEPVASILKKAMEDYASGKLASQSEVARFLSSKAGFPKPPKGQVHTQTVHKFLGKSIYAGYIDVPKWNLYLQPGKHEPLISFETLQKIKKRMDAQAYIPARKDLDEDFPLRGFVSCGCCGQPLTAGWTKGRNGRYPYYLCFTKGCEDYRKSVRKHIIEGEFEALLQSLRPSQDLFFMVKDMIEDIWEDRVHNRNNETKSLETELKTIERKVEQFLNRIVETDTNALVATYENQVRKLEEKKIEITEKIQKCGRPLDTFEDTFRTAFRFLANPCFLWESDRLEDKRTVLKLVFAERLRYYRNEGLRTAGISLPFCFIEQLKGSDLNMVEAGGIEPPSESF